MEQLLAALMGSSSMSPVAGGNPFMSVGGPVAPAPAQPTMQTPRMRPQRPVSAVGAVPPPAPATPGVQYVDISSQSRFARRAQPMQSVDGFIIHHTGPVAGGAEKVVDILNQRGLSVQYVIDRDGTVYRTMPEGTRASHVKSPDHRQRNRPAIKNALGDRFEVAHSLSNSNALGVEIIAADDRDVRPEQVEAARNLIADTQARYGFPAENVFGHGEIQGDKQTTEGQTVVSSYRGEPPTVVAQESDPFGVNEFQRERENATLAGDPDVDKLARVMLAEARGEGPEGMAAVAQVAMNRVADQSGRFPNSLGDVLNNEFAAPLAADDKRISPEQMAEAQRLAAGVQSGEIYNPQVGQSLYFMNPATASPDGARMIEESGQKLATIGNHSFYGPAGGEPGPRLAAAQPQPEQMEQPAPTTAVEAVTQMAGGSTPRLPSMTAYADPSPGMAMTDMHPDRPYKEEDSFENRYGGQERGGPTLRRGAEGADVRRLQQELADRGLYEGNIDGDFGRQTEAAVRAFQEQAGIGVDGVVGRNTWGALGPESPPDAPRARPRLGAVQNVEQAVEQRQETKAAKRASIPEGRPLLRRGAKGDDVKALQQAIADRMPDMVPDDFVDGNFGPYTEGAVRHLQKQAGIQVDGDVGPQTWGVLSDTMTLSPSATTGAGQGASVSGEMELTREPGPPAMRDPDSRMDPRRQIETDTARILADQSNRERQWNREVEANRPRLPSLVRTPPERPIGSLPAAREPARPRFGGFPQGQEAGPEVMAAAQRATFDRLRGPDIPGAGSLDHAGAMTRFARGALPEQNFLTDIGVYDAPPVAARQPRFSGFPRSADESAARMAASTSAAAQPASVRAAAAPRIGAPAVETKASTPTAPTQPGQPGSSSTPRFGSGYSQSGGYAQQSTPPAASPGSQSYFDQRTGTWQTFNPTSGSYQEAY